MTRYRTYGKLDDPMREVGDTGFLGLASRDEPTQLQAGLVSEAKNVRMDDGKVTTRLGYKEKVDISDSFLITESNEPLATETGTAFQNLYAFGNSYTDHGNNPDLTSAHQKVWVQYLAESLGLDFNPADEGGTNYAFAGARLVTQYNQGSTSITPISSQIASAPNFGSDDLVTFFGGGNDYVGEGASVATINARIKTQLESLISKGAKHILVLNILDLFKLPAVTDSQATTDSQSMNTQLSTDIGQLDTANSDVTFYLIDFFTLINQIAADPSSYGVTDLFYDNLHLTKEVHQVISDNAYMALATAESNELLQTEDAESESLFSSIYFGGIGQSDRNQVLMVQESELVFWDGNSISTKPLALPLNFNPVLPLYLDFTIDVEETTFSPDRIEPVQFNSQLILLTGKGPSLPIQLDFLLTQAVQKWDGASENDFAEDANIVNGDFGVVTGNRLAVLTNRDKISFSDIANESNFDFTNEFSFGEGDGDDIIGMSPIPESSALVFKRRSCWAITGLNNMASASITQVSRQTGCVSRHSIQNVGSSVFFLGDNGVYAINIGLDASNARGTLTRFDLQDEPLSKPINDQILAENFDEAERSCRSVFFNNRYYLSFTDDIKSRVYLFNTLTRAWESRDEYSFAINDFVRAKTGADSNERLYATDRSGQLYLMDEGSDDDGTPISWALNTRAYDNQNLEVKNFRRGYVKVESLDSTGSTSLDVEVTDPDGTLTIPLDRPNNEGYIERFSIGKRGNSLKYKFSGTGRNAIKHLRAEFIESSNNLISTNQ